LVERGRRGCPDRAHREDGVTGPIAILLNNAWGAHEEGHDLPFGMLTYSWGMGNPGDQIKRPFYVSKYSNLEIVVDLDIDSGSEFQWTAYGDDSRTPVFLSGGIVMRLS